jgi:hypothetical protein
MAIHIYYSRETLEVAMFHHRLLLIRSSPTTNKAKVSRRSQALLLVARTLHHLPSLTCSNLSPSLASVLNISINNSPQALLQALLQAHLLNFLPSLASLLNSNNSPQPQAVLLLLSSLASYLNLNINNSPRALVQAHLLNFPSSLASVLNLNNSPQPQALLLLLSALARASSKRFAPRVML